VELAAALNNALKRKPRDTSQLKLDVFVRAVMSCLMCPPAMALRERERVRRNIANKTAERQTYGGRERERDKLSFVSESQQHILKGQTIPKHIKDS
jgi:hypothetical protein